MALPTITSTTTDIWVTFWNNTFLPWLAGQISGAGGWPFPLTQNGRVVLDEADAGKAQMTGTPSLAIILPDGAQYVVGGTLYTVSGDQTLTVSDSFEGWLEPTVEVDESDVVTWGTIEHEEHPAPGTGVLGKVTSNVDHVIALDTSESESDVILSMPLLLQRLNGTGGEGGEAPFWDLLKRSGINPQTISQFVVSEINARLGVGQGATIIPPEVRDEVMVNTLHSLAMHQLTIDDIFERVPPLHAASVSPGRGTGAFAFDELMDLELTTMPYDEINHVWGQTE